MPWPFDATPDAACAPAMPDTRTSDMERQMRAFPWETTAVGPVSTWPQSLKHAVRTVLDLRMPAYLAWGESYIQFFNDAYVPILGAKAQNALGVDTRLTWPEAWPTIAPLWEQVRQGATFADDEFQITLNRNGFAESCYFSHSYSPIYSPSGAIEGIFVTCVETTKAVMGERRKAYQLKLADTLRRETEFGPMLKATIRLTSEYFTGSKVAYVELDEGQRSFSVKEEWMEGVETGGAHGTLPLDMLSPDQLEQLRAGTTICINDVKTDPACAPVAMPCLSLGIHSVVVIPLKDGNRLHGAGFLYKDHAYRWTDDDRTLAEDLARRTWEALRRIRAEEALREETRMLELLNRAGNALASTLDIDTLLQAITDAATELTGAEFGSFFYNGKDENGDAYLLYTLSGAPREAFAHLGHPRTTAIFGPTFHGAAPIRSDDITKDPRYGRMGPHHGMPKGHLPVRSYLAASVYSRSGEVLGGLFFGHSQTHRFDERTEQLITGFVAQAAVAIDNARLYELAQRAAKEREGLLASERAARAEAERHSKMKDEFLAMLAHELRNPLAPIINAAQLLKMPTVDENLRLKAGNIISRQVRHMTELVDDLLDVSRVTRGLVKLDTEPLALDAVLRAAVEQARPHIEAREHLLTVEAPALPVVVAGDRTRLVQVLVNLLNNAAKYTPPQGRITLRLEASLEAARMTVIDNGCGMDAKLLPHVFDLFTQAERTPDRSQGGLGIGLALVKSIVQMHGGQVEAHSDGLNLGTSVSVLLPLVDAAGAPGPAHLHSAARTVSPCLLTIVDDNVDAAQSLAVLLRAQGHSVNVFEDGVRTLASSEIAQTHAFILDIGLPDMTGYELARRLRREHPQAVFIALTGYGQERDRDLSKAAGFDYHLVKPVEFRALADILAQLPQSQAAAQEEAPRKPEPDVAELA
ncbi:GAF domain-containing protein [Telluria aromaticivorans]|uniref:histidine kinase n=1 Tax=Telluria aromaticivorans TaxID=2725995 RepID=A0A7Y2JZT9_9BURK|nr:GAF domain-containing protein [Telluria aromaticivorans]NNG24061.1 GAF domain-containing protein [Telluria aromaticivorans]